MSSGFRILSLLLLVHQAMACCSYYGCFCVYTLWYFWFGLFWAIILITILVVTCVKKHNRTRARVGNVAVIAGSGPSAPQKGPIPPPAYEQPSHAPPPYNPNHQQNRPNYPQNQSNYPQNQPNYPQNQPNYPQNQPSYPPPPLDANPASTAYPPPPNLYPPSSQPMPTNDPAYPPNP